MEKRTAGTMTKHTPITDYHPWAFWVLDVLILGPTLFLFGLVVLWRMAHDEARYRDRGKDSREKMQALPPDLAKEMGQAQFRSPNLDQQRARLEEIWRK